MNTTNLVPQALEQQSTAEGTLYFPFTDGEIVQSVLFSEPTENEILRVENFESISSQEVSEAIIIGNLKTACLVVKTKKAVTVTVLTLKNNNQ